MSKKVSEVLWEGKSSWLRWEHGVGLLFFWMGIQETWTLAQAWPTTWQGHGGSSLWFSFLIHKMRDLDIKLLLRLLLILGILGISSEMGKSRQPQSAALSPNTKVSLCLCPPLISPVFNPNSGEEAEGMWWQRKGGWEARGDNKMADDGDSGQKLDTHSEKRLGGKRGVKGCLWLPSFAQQIKQQLKRMKSLH